MKKKSILIGGSVLLFFVFLFLIDLSPLAGLFVQSFIAKARDQDLSITVEGEKFSQGSLLFDRLSFSFPPHLVPFECKKGTLSPSYSSLLILAPKVSGNCLAYAGTLAIEGQWYPFSTQGKGWLKGEGLHVAEFPLFSFLGIREGSISLTVEEATFSLEKGWSAHLTVQGKDIEKPSSTTLPPTFTQGIKFTVPAFSLERVSITSTLSQMTGRAVVGEGDLSLTFAKKDMPELGTYLTLLTGKEPPLQARTVKGIINGPLEFPTSYKWQYE